jgi:DNA-binding transcriptional LysR family regulator
MGKQSKRIDVADFALFTSVVEQRSFSAAARATHTTTSAASKRIARLEARLGARLLERTTRRVVPTEAGAAFYARAARIVSDVDEAESEIASLGGAPRGTLRVSAPVILGERHLAALLPPFLARHPEMRIDLSLGDQFVNLLADRFDVALRVGPLVDSSLVRSRIGAAASVVVAAPRYLARAGRPQSPGDLLRQRHNCMRYSNVSVAREWRFRQGPRETAVPVLGTLEVNHGGAMREAAIAGLGIARLPDFLVADALRSGDLVALLEDYEVPPTGIALVYPRGAHPLPKLDVFVHEIGAALRERLGRLQPRVERSARGRVPAS